MARAKNYIAYLISAIAAAALTHAIRSTVIADVVVPALPAVVLALLAINVQTSAVIAVKLRELANTQKGMFGASIAEVRFALIEQAILVLFAFALNALVKAPSAPLSPHVISVAAYVVLFASLHIFIDTTISLLDLLFPD